VVYIATGSSFPDALAGGPAARVGNGPLLLTASGSLPSATATELGRLKPGRIVILGGTGVVSGAVQTALRSYTVGAVTRVAGSDRYATAAAISSSAFAAGASVVYVATGSTFPDALAAGAAAARRKVPILLVGSNALPGATASELSRLDPDEIIVMGGTSMVSNAVLQQLGGYAGTVRRIAGADRYATAVNLSASTFAANSVNTVYLAAGSSFPDGLSAGPVAGARGAPLLLVPSGFLPDSVAVELKRLDPSQVIIVGGTAIVTETVRNQIRALWP
ncbi:MAG TPA: cell wall-binding repeat-containing protein, partial [Candidatus Limnocylindrales bacterium]|nr:cell wall-binding repeat-containing protein [Candidatus Limnocylindrales bacterium]